VFLLPLKSNQQVLILESNFSPCKINVHKNQTLPGMVFKAYYNNTNVNAMDKSSTGKEK